MSYKLGSNPSSRATHVEVADFWELECLADTNFSVSTLTLLKRLGLTEDSQENHPEEEDYNEESLLPDVASEIRRRISRCAEKYPFSFENGILSINYNCDTLNFWVYVYLLIATRNNMSTNRLVGQIDGGLLLEYLGLPILLNYFGERADGIVFGTGTEGDFVAKLKELQSKFHDGFLHIHAAEITRHVKDDKLDIAVWKPFFDNSASKLICFCQCKTGDSWHNAVSDLDVNKFLKKWFSTHPALNPIRAFMVADVVGSVEFAHTVINNLFFDRCRILDYLPNKINDECLSSIITWTFSVLSQFNINPPNQFINDSAIAV